MTRMKAVGIAVLCLTTDAILASAEAAVLCATRGGKVFARESCKRREQALDLADFGAAQGPEGPQGPTGPQGPAGSATPSVIVTLLSYNDEQSSGPLTICLGGDNDQLPCDDVGDCPNGGSCSGVSDYFKLRDIGPFTKTTASSAVKLTWHSHVNQTGLFCDLQVRVDDVDDGAGGGRAVVRSTDAPISTGSVFRDLAAGPHTVNIWVRGFGDDCTENYQNFNHEVIVEEILE